MAGRPGAAAAWLLSLYLASPSPLPLGAQTVATLEIGPSVVEYDGFLVSGAAIASSSLRYDTSTLSLGTLAQAPAGGADLPLVRARDQVAGLDLARHRLPSLFRTAAASARRPRPALPVGLERAPTRAGWW